jgi:PAS domain S-box-containing protein
MLWLVAGVAYAVVYAVAVWMAAAAPAARMWIGNVGLLLPPIVPIVVILRRRREWAGHQRVFWDAIAAGAALWLVGQIAWLTDELFLGRTLPWLGWVTVPQLCGSLMPLLALVARPHRGERRETALTALLDLYVLAALSGFLYWSLIILPGLDPGGAAAARRMLAVGGPAVRLAVFVGLLLARRAARGGAWAAAYQRLAIGALVSFVVLIVLAGHVGDGTYRTGSPLDIAWILPFWFYAWAASMMPASKPEPQRSIVAASRPAPPVLLFAVLAAVPVIGFGGRYVLPVAEPLERYREGVTALTLVFGLVMAMVRSIVERRELRYADRQVRLLAAACEQSDEMIVIVQKGAIRYANDAFCRRAGYSSGELESLAPHALDPPGSRDLVARLEYAQSRAETTRVTTTITRKDGTSFQADCTITPIADPGRGGTHLVCVMRDLTEDLRLQAQIVRVERMSAIGELLSGVAHEINNPLQSVVGSIELMLQSKPNPELREDLERASREAERAVRIIRNLLAFVRRSPTERMLSDLTEIVQTVVRLRAYDLRSTNIELREEYAPNLPIVLANRDEIQQAVLNLIVNAQESMIAANGRGVLTIRTFARGSDPVLDVCDDGAGVSPEVAGRIFEPFFTTRRSGDRSGLGLSAAFGIAEAHGGTLELVAGPRGACFRLTLPGAGLPGPAHIQYN